MAEKTETEETIPVEGPRPVPEPKLILELCPIKKRFISPDLGAFRNTPHYQNGLVYGSATTDNPIHTPSQPITIVDLLHADEAVEHLFQGAEGTDYAWQAGRKQYEVNFRRDFYNNEAMRVVAAQDKLSLERQVLPGARSKLFTPAAIQTYCACLERLAVFDGMVDKYQGKVEDLRGQIKKTRGKAKTAELQEDLARERLKLQEVKWARDGLTHFVKSEEGLNASTLWYLSGKEPRISSPKTAQKVYQGIIEILCGQIDTNEQTIEEQQRDMLTRVYRGGK